MMGAFVRMGVGMGAIVVALPACLVLVWVAMGCMWVLGLLSVMKLGLRLMWSPRVGPRGKRNMVEKKLRRHDVVSAEMRLSLFQQYLDDQLNTLAHQLLHVCRSDSLPNQTDLNPLHVDSCDWASSQVDDQDCL